MKKAICYLQNSWKQLVKNIATAIQQCIEISNPQRENVRLISNVWFACKSHAKCMRL